MDFTVFSFIIGKYDVLFIYHLNRQNVITTPSGEYYFLVPIVMVTRLKFCIGVCNDVHVYRGVYRSDDIYVVIYKYVNWKVYFKPIG